MADLGPIEGTGLLVIDVQNGFCDPRSEFGKRADLSAIQAAIPPIVRLIRVCHAAGLPVWFSKQEHYPNDLARRRRTIPSHMDRGHGAPCMRGTWEVDLVPEVAAEAGPDDSIYVKHRASCFFDSPLDTELRMRAVRRLIISGVTTNFCVDTTIREAYARDYDVIVPADAVAAAGAFPELHAATLRNVELYFGLVTTVAEVEAWLAGARKEAIV
jgi:ureidoacrylate peracid hydrolase